MESPPHIISVYPLLFLLSKRRLLDRRASHLCCVYASRLALSLPVLCCLLSPDPHTDCQSSTVAPLLAAVPHEQHQKGGLTTGFKQ